MLIQVIYNRNWRTSSLQKSMAQIWGCKNFGLLLGIHYMHQNVDYWARKHSWNTRIQPRLKIQLLLFTVINGIVFFNFSCKTTPEITYTISQVFCFMHGYPGICPNWSGTQAFSEENSVPWCCYSQCEDNIAEISGTARSKDISSSWDIRKRKDGHGSVPSKAGDVQPGSLSWRKHHHKDFVWRSKCSGKSDRNGLSLPPIRPEVAEPEALLPSHVLASNLTLCWFWFQHFSLHMVCQRGMVLVLPGCTGPILASFCHLNVPSDRALIRPLTFFSHLASHHVNDSEQCCFNHMTPCTSSCGSHPPKFHLLVFILGHQINWGMDSWTNSTLPSAATKHMHWEINLKPKRNKREDSALLN